ncbi:hypothetical protein O6H91_15G039700 [Diphasiastrum complanatum]|uniref:Uncharacterized protein n=1 Tax=Diphasiastrum complanatum TaxID=34168 RepID=A0ACC2BHL4_DIPCM|nr:hypothetical protein O6H91_15G039700 [Diphasiastrum complanatum]
MGNQTEESLLDDLDEETRDPSKVQEEVLCRILRDNLHTEYLRRCGLTAAAKSAFKERIPIVKYEDMKPDIDRIANGDSSPILFFERVAKFLISSGTSTGEHKLYPKPAGHPERSQRLRNITSAVFYKHFPDLKKGKRLNFLYAREQGITPCGLNTQTAITSLIQRSTSRNDFSNLTMSLPEVLLCTDSFQSTYCQLLCGLMQSPEVVNVGSFFASTFVRIIRSIEDYWADLCEDLESGQLNGKITNLSVRKAMARVLRPNPELASRVRVACWKTSWQGIVKRLWPNTRVIQTVVSGSMQQYIPTIDYYSDGIQIVSMVYASSETYLGFNLNPICSPWEITYMLAPSAAYFEFLPIDRSSEFGEQLTSDLCIDSQAVVDLTDVQVGKEYELLVTTDTGLYRYRMGDILKVAGYYNASPTFFFVCRQNVLLSIDSDKTDEKDLQNAITTAASSSRKIVRDYSSYADLESKPPHYVIFWELAEDTPIEAHELKECCYVMEESLASTYRRGRRENAIGPLEIRLVKKGSFEKLMDCCVAGGANVGQVKVPRCLKRPSSLLQAMEEGVYQIAFSARLPSYSPTILLSPPTTAIAIATENKN